MSWLLLSLLAPLFWAITNFVDKFVLDRYIASTPDFLFFSSVSSFVFLPFVVMFLGVPPLEWFGLVPFAIGIIQIGSYGLYAKALAKGETSSLLMLVGVSPVIVIIIGYLFLGQVLDKIELLASSIVVAGVMIVMVEDIRSFSLKFFFKPGAGGMLGVVTIWSVNLVAADWALQKMPFETFFVYDMLGMASAGFLLFFAPALREKVVAGIRSAQPAKFGWFLLNTFLDTAAQFCLKLALSLAPIAGLVAVAMQIQNFYLVAIGYALTVFVPHIITEDISAQILCRKIIGALLMIMGIAMLKL